MSDFKDPKQPFSIVKKALTDVTRRKAYKDMDLYIQDYVAYSADTFEDEDGKEFKAVNIEVDIAAEDPPTEWTAGRWFHGFLKNTKRLQLRLDSVHVWEEGLLYRFSGGYALYD